MAGDRIVERQYRHLFNAKKSGSAEMTINDRLLVVEWPGKTTERDQRPAVCHPVFRRYQPQLVIKVISQRYHAFCCFLFAVSQRVCYIIIPWCSNILKMLAGLTWHNGSIYGEKVSLSARTHVLRFLSAAKADITR